MSRGGHGFVISPSTHGDRELRTLELFASAKDAAPAERRKPKPSPAVAGIDHGLRICGPGRLDSVASCVGESERFTVTQIAEPKVPVSAL